MRAYKTVYGDISSTQAPAKRDIGSVDGMSHIMRRSVDGDGLDGRHLVDDDDSLQLYSELKDLLRLNFNTFDDLLQRMGKPSFTQEKVVTFKDFETLIKSMP